MSALDLMKIRIQNKEINSFFDCLADILLKISGGTLYEDKNFNKYFSVYVLCRYISMRSDLIQYAEILNQLQTIITSQQLYKLAYNIIPIQKSSFIKYIKKNKQDKDIENSSNNTIKEINIIKTSIFEL